MKLLVINGPNLDMLGVREPEIYGKETLPQIIKHTEKVLSGYKCDDLDQVELEWYQSNSEGDLVSKIGQAAKGGHKGIIINPAAYTHTSVAICDALKICQFPIVEVHLSNTNSREEMRKNKITTQSVNMVIEGAGKNVYALAVLSLLIKG